MTEESGSNLELSSKLEATVIDGEIKLEEVLRALAQKHDENPYDTVRTTDEGAGFVVRNSRTETYSYRNGRIMRANFSLSRHEWVFEPINDTESVQIGDRAILERVDYLERI